MNYERKLGLAMISYMVIMALLLLIHWQQGALPEDQTWVWSCHTMGNKLCGPGQPWISFAWENFPWPKDR